MKIRKYPEYKTTEFPWIRNLPAHWEAGQLRYVCHFAYGDSLPQEERAEGDVPVFGSNGIVGWHDKTNTHAPAIVVGRKGSFGKVNYSENEAFAIDTTYFIDCRYSTSNLRWLFYLLNCLELDAHSKDSAVPGLAREDAYSNRVPIVDDQKEQEQIANFLDAATGKIDALVAQKRELIDLLEEKRRALITRCVTRGLPPAAARAAGLNPHPKLKPSGIDWLGEIPEDWDVKQLRRLVTRFVDYRGRTPSKTDEGVPLITAGAVRDGRIDHDRCPEYIAEEDFEAWMTRGMPEIGDVVLTTEAPLAEVAQVEDTDAAFAQRIILFKNNRKRMLPAFMKYYYLSDCGRSELLSRASGSTALGIRADRLKMSLVPTPKIGEQTKIVDYLTPIIHGLEEPAQVIKEAIDTLLEYRSALITAAVAGKIDVRGVKL